MTELEVFHDQDATVDVRFFPFRALFLIEKGVKSGKTCCSFYKENIAPGLGV